MSGLKLRFTDPAAFCEEYRRNISMGGAFVPTMAQWELRSTAELEIELAFLGERLELEVEIVHCLSAEMAGDPSRAGVAIQFLAPAPQIRDRLEPLVERAEVAARHAATGSKSAEAQAPSVATTPPAPELDELELDDSLIQEALSGEDLGAHLELSADDLSVPPELSGDDVGAPPEPSDTGPEPLELEDPLGESISVHYDGGSLADPPPDPLPPSALAGPAADAGPSSSPEPQATDAASSQEAPDDPLAAFDPSLIDLPEDDEAPAPTSAASAQPGAQPQGAETPEAFPAEPDRRKAQRDRARIPVRVDAGNARLEGHTRDLSDTGLLISVDGTAIPVGKPVIVTLTRPRDGTRIEIHGSVARHLETEGTVAAVGIEFAPGTADREDLKALFVDMRALESERREGGMSGSIDELGMPGLLQMLGSAAPRGTLTASRGAEEGVIAFEGGQIRYVRLGGMRGMKALVRLCSWKDGSFEFHAQVDDLGEEDEPISLQGALLDAARELDEVARLDLHQSELDPASRLAVDMPALTRESPQLDKTEEAVIDLAVAGFTLRRVLDVIPEADARVLEALGSLVDRGFVRILPRE